VSTSDESIPPIPKDEQTEIEDVSELLYNEYDMICEEKSSPNDISMLEDKVDNLQHLSDLSVVSIIQFCNNYCDYTLSMSESIEIQDYIDDKVKALFLSTKTAKQWRILKVVDFKNLSNNDTILFLQDYCTPTSRRDFYTNLKAVTTHLSPNLVLNNGTNNFELFYKEFNLYVKTFKYAYAFLLDYTASKHEIPYTNAKCDSVLTLKNLFLSQLPKSLIDNIYGKTHQRLSRYKNIDSLIRSSEKAVHTLFKQYCKSCQAISKT
jgi:hypothetical protein